MNTTILLHTDMRNMVLPLLISNAKYCARLAFNVPPKVSSFSPTVPLTLDLTLLRVCTSERNSNMSDR